jgi:ribokinase
MPRIVVIGSCNVDLTTLVDRLPKPGETIFGRRFDLGFGGKGANQAIAARRCGASVAIIARVGDDVFGRAAVENFEQAGVDATHVVQVPGVSTGVAPIFVDARGQNRIVVVKGANDALTPADVDRAASLLEQADCLVLQFEIPFETVIHAARFAVAHRIRCIVNPAPALPVDIAKLAGVDYLVPNETEAEALAGRPVRTESEIEACARTLLGCGVRRVILTLGERGALLADAHRMELIPAFHVETQDSTGAGDAFIGSFATFLVEGASEPEAISRANFYAALSTTKVGTQKSFCTREDFEKEWHLKKSEV